MRSAGPEFQNPMENITVPQGRDAKFTCVVNNLGGYGVSPSSSASGDHGVVPNVRVTIYLSENEKSH